MSAQFAERRRKMTDALYEQVKVQHRDLFDQCVGMGVVARDGIENRDWDALKVAAEVERSAVLLVASALGLRYTPGDEESGGLMRPNGRSVDEV